jgi:hypothetical protein
MNVHMLDIYRDRQIHKSLYVNTHIYEYTNMFLFIYLSIYVYDYRVGNGVYFPIIVLRPT